MIQPIRMITRIELENFRGFINKRNDILVDADLVLLTGKNGVGKTSLLQAITLILNGYDKNIFNELDLCNRFSKGRISRIFIPGINQLEESPLGYSDKDWQQWKSPFKSSQWALNPSIARVSTAYFQDNVKELANEEFLTYLTGAGNQGQEVVQWIKSAKDKWEKLAEEPLSATAKNWDDLRKDILAKIFENKVQFPIDSDCARLFLDFSPLLNNGNLSDTWKNQIINMGKKIGLTEATIFHSEFLNRFIQGILELQEKIEKAQKDEKKQIETNEEWSKSLSRMLEQIDEKIFLFQKSELESTETQVIEIQHKLELLRKEYEELKSCEPQTAAVEQLIGTLESNLPHVVAEVQRLEKAKLSMPEEICSFFKELQKIYSAGDRSLSEIYIVWYNKLKQALADKSQQILNQSKQIENYRKSIELSKHILKNDKGINFLVANHGEIGKQKVLEAFRDDILVYSTTSEINRGKDVLTLLRNIETQFRELLITEVEFEKNENEKRKMLGFDEARNFARLWMDAFSKETLRSGQFISLLNELDLASVISELKNVLSIFHLPNDFVTNIKLEQKGVGKNAKIVPSLNGLDFVNLSTGQKTIFALAWTVVLNNALRSKIGHNVVLFDDITTSLDLNQIGPACILFRKLAYAKDAKHRRQLFISSHHEDLTNRMIDFLIPPEGFVMKIMEFKEFSSENGPEYDIWDVAPSGAFKSDQSVS